MKWVNKGMLNSYFPASDIFAFLWRSEALMNDSSSSPLHCSKRLPRASAVPKGATFQLWLMKLHWPIIPHFICSSVSLNALYVTVRDRFTQNITLCLCKCAFLNHSWFHILFQAVEGRWQTQSKKNIWVNTIPKGGYFLKFSTLNRGVFQMLIFASLYLTQFQLARWISETAVREALNWVVST